MFFGCQSRQAGVRQISSSALKRSAAVSRKLRLLRAHGLIKKIPGSHRYLLTVEGRKLITLLMAARKADIEQLAAFAT